MKKKVGVSTRLLRELIPALPRHHRGPGRFAGLEFTARLRFAAAARRALKLPIITTSGMVMTRMMAITQYVGVFTAFLSHASLPDAVAAPGRRLPTGLDNISFKAAKPAGFRWGSSGRGGRFLSLSHCRAKPAAAISSGPRPSIQTGLQS